MGLVKWTFANPVSDASATFLLNPKDGGSPQYERNLTYQYPTAYGNVAAHIPRVVIFEGARAPRTIDFSGTIIDSDEYEMFRTWYETRSPIVLTDDLERSFTVVIKTFKPKRVRSARHPWKHTYDVSATVISGAS